MADYDTVKAITDNLITVLSGLGIKFSKQTFDDEKDIPASLIPHGQVFYKRETFEYMHGQKPEYAEIDFLLKVTLRESAPDDLMREQQRWAHLIRDGLTVNALNIGDLAPSKLVSRAITESVEAAATSTGMGMVSYAVRIRYREL